MSRLIIGSLLALVAQVGPSHGAPSDISIPDQQLSLGHGESRTTFNFAHSIVAAEAGRLHAVWQSTRDGRSHVYYRRSPNDGKTWENIQRLSEDGGSHEHPSIAVSGDNVFVVWHGFRLENRPVVYLRRSSDGGRNWDHAQVTCDSGTAAHASVAVVRENVHLIWKDHRAGDTEVYYRRSVDGGRTFEVERRLTDAPAISYVPSLAASGQLVVLAWVDTRDGNEEEYVKISTDGGTSWGADTRMTNDRMNSWAPSISVVGQTIHLVWFDQKDAPREFDEMGEPVYLLARAEKALDKALTLIGAKLDAEAGDANTVDAIQRRMQAKVRKVEQHGPKWVAQGGDPRELQTVMNQFEQALRRAQRTSAYVNKERKLDEALKLMNISFTPNLPDRLPFKHYGDVAQLRVQAKQQDLMAAAPGWAQKGGSQKQLETLLKEFERRVKIAQLEWDIYYRRSDDAGKTWADEQRLVAAPGLSHRPNLTVSGNVLHLVWWDNRESNDEIYYKQSVDGGRSWGQDLRLTDTASASQFPMVATTESGAHVIWTELRDGGSQVFYKSLQE